MSSTYSMNLDFSVLWIFADLLLDCVRDLALATPFTPPATKLRGELFRRPPGNQSAAD